MVGMAKTATVKGPLTKGRANMAFMKPQIEYGTWVVVDGPMGTEAIPQDVCGEIPTYLSQDNDYKRCLIPDALHDYCENREAYSIQTVTGWGARYSAPGYLDCTEWKVFDTEEEAKAYLADDMDGDDLEDEGDDR